MMAVDSTKRGGPLAYTIKTRGFDLRSDVTVENGGQGSGPIPHDYVETGLAACTAITMQMYARHKHIPLDDVDIKVKIVEEGQVNRMTCEILLIGHLSEEQRQSLLRIAEKCPIHLFLSRGAKIETTLI